MTQQAIRTIALVHRQGTMSLLGFPLRRYIDTNDSETAQELQGSDPGHRRLRANRANQAAAGP